MKAAIVYYSKHHSNTKKLLDAIAASHEVTLIDVTDTKEADLSVFDRIGFASGIYMQKYHDSVMKFAETNLLEGKPVFLIYTYGMKLPIYTNAIRSVLKKKNATVLGEYGCLGFDTVGPFKLVGGVAKGHPNQEEIAGAVAFSKSWGNAVKRRKPAPISREVTV